MAQNQSPAFFAVTLLLFAAATPLAVAQAPPALPIVGGLIPPLGSVLSGVIVNGSVCCTPTGNCPGGPPLVGIPVRVVCRISGINVTVGQGITGITGNFSIAIGNIINTVAGPVAAILGGMIPCTAEIDLPLSPSVCSVLNLTSSLLSSALTIVGFVFNLLGSIVGIVSVTFGVVRA